MMNVLQDLPVWEPYDLVVVGATPGGIATAVRAAREGLRVLLVARGRHLGGMLAGGLNVEDTLYLGNRAPLYTEFREGVKAHYRDTYGEDSPQYTTCVAGRLTFEPRVAEAVLTHMVEAEPNVEIWRGYVPVSVERAGRVVGAVTLAPFDGRRMDERPEAQRRVVARAFCDSTYEGDLAALAGVPYRAGRESRAEFGELHAGKIFTDHIAGHFPIEAHEGRLNLLTFGYVGGAIYAGSTGEGDRAVQSFNYRVCLTNDPADRLLPERPSSYRRWDFEGVLADPRASVKTPYPLKSQLVLADGTKLRFGSRGSTPNQKMSWNNPSLPEGGHGWAEGSWAERHAIERRHWDHAMGLLWFLQNDPELPDAVHASAREWGLAKDEFADNDHVPYELYVREARRIVGRYTFSEHDGTLAPGLDRAPIHPDSIAITEWPMDSHECRLERRYGSLYDGKILLSEETRPGQVPYRCVLPQDLDNLLVPVAMSCTHVGWGTLRLEPTWMHAGESAGHAVALAQELGVAPAAVPVEHLQRRLVEHGVMLGFFNEFDMSTDEPWVPAVQYLSTKGFFTSYDARPAEPLDEATAAAWSRLAGFDVRAGDPSGGHVTTRGAAAQRIYEARGGRRP
jgi:hypothetical protein